MYISTKYCESITRLVEGAEWFHRFCIRARIGKGGARERQIGEEEELSDATVISLVGHLWLRRANFASCWKAGRGRGQGNQSVVGQSAPNSSFGPGHMIVLCNFLQSSGKLSRVFDRLGAWSNSAYDGLHHSVYAITTGGHSCGGCKLLRRRSSEGSAVEGSDHDCPRSTSETAGVWDYIGN